MKRRKSKEKQHYWLITHTLAGRLRAAKEQGGWTEQKLANRAGMTRGALSHLLGGLSQAQTHLASLAVVLKVEEAWLRTGQGPRPFWLVQAWNQFFDLLILRVRFGIRKAPTCLLDWPADKWLAEHQLAIDREVADGKGNGAAHRLAKNQRLSRDEVAAFRQGYLQLRIERECGLAMSEAKVPRDVIHRVRSTPLVRKHFHLVVHTLHSLKELLQAQGTAELTLGIWKFSVPGGIDDAIEAVIARQYAVTDRAPPVLKELTGRTKWTKAPAEALWPGPVEPEAQPQ